MQQKWKKIRAKEEEDGTKKLFLDKLLIWADTEGVLVIKKHS